MKYLLDTLVISEMTKPRPSARVRRWLDAHPIGACALSVITFGEIAKGIQLMTPGPRRTGLLDWSQNWLTAAFGGRILPVDRNIAEAWGELEARARRTLPAADALIAATAMVHGLAVATRNERDFVDMGIAIINPWTD